MATGTPAQDELDQFGKQFVTSYYQAFDTNAKENLAAFYVPDAVSSQLSFEGKKFSGRQEITEKLNSLSFQQIAHDITSIDATAVENGVLLVVVGRLRTDNDPVHSFTQTFFLKPLGDGTWYILMDNFRIILHNTV